MKKVNRKDTLLMLFYIRSLDRLKTSLTTLQNEFISLMAQYRRLRLQQIIPMPPSLQGITFDEWKDKMIKVFSKNAVDFTVSATQKKAIFSKIGDYADHSFDEPITVNTSAINDLVVYLDSIVTRERLPKVLEEFYLWYEFQLIEKKVSSNRLFFKRHHSGHLGTKVSISLQKQQARLFDSMTSCVRRANVVAVCLKKISRFNFQYHSLSEFKD